MMFRTTAVGRLNMVNISYEFIITKCNTYTCLAIYLYSILQRTKLLFNLNCIFDLIIVQNWIQVWI